jgi:hypothetical protein
VIPAIVELKALPGHEMADRFRQEDLAGPGLRRDA